MTDDAAKLLAMHLNRLEREVLELRRLALSQKGDTSRSADLAAFPADVRWMVGAYER